MQRPRLPAERIILALDTADPARAAQWCRAASGQFGLVKLGLEFFLAAGAAGYRAIASAAEKPVFLDLKLHDIPNTVAGAVRAVLPLAPRLLTVHAAGGAAMIAAARRAMEDASQGERPILLAVTVLTSLDAAALAATGIVGGPTQQVVRLARLAVDAGADGLVCSPREVMPIRAALGAGPVLVVPGVRPVGVAGDDQARTMTPREAVDAGADWLVIGRPITAVADPAAAAAAIAASLA